MDRFLAQLAEWCKSPWEVAGVATGLASVVWLVREKVAGWPAGLLSALAYGVFFLQGRLYANAALQLLYVALYLYGWVLWGRGGRDAGPAIGWQRPRQRWGLLLAGVPATLAVGAYLGRFTAAPTTPWVDAGTAAYSVIGQWLQARKFMENWPLWLVVNLVYVGWFVALGDRLSAVLYAVFAALAVAGWRAWARTLRETARP